MAARQAKRNGGGIRLLTMGLILVGLAIVSFSALARETVPAVASIDKRVEEVQPLVNRVYRSIHEHPELGKEEKETQALLEGELRQLGFAEFRKSEKAPTTVIAVLDTGSPGPTIALRAEMDALGLPERKEEPADHDPRSQVPGVMHCCGHDSHAAMLLGAAAVLKAEPALASGKIVFLFQPAEEVKGGADDIVNEGILTELGVKSVFAQHVTPGMPVGTVSISPGYTMAGSNYFSLVVKGQGSHAAAPWEGCDIPLATAALVEGISHLPARRVNITERPIVVSVACIQTGNPKVSNVIPSESLVKGTVRAFEDITKPYGTQVAFSDVLRSYLDGESKALGVEYELDLRKGSPPLRNDEELFNEIVNKLKPLWSGVLDTKLSRGMFSEDFAYFTETLPCLYFGLGIADGGLGEGALHSEQFTVAPKALEVGTRLMVLLAHVATGEEG